MCHSRKRLEGEGVEKKPKFSIKYFLNGLNNSTGLQHFGNAIPLQVFQSMPTNFPRKDNRILKNDRSFFSYLRIFFHFLSVILLLAWNVKQQGKMCLQVET